MPNDVQGQVGQSVGVPVMPRVNLMPPEIAEAARFRRLQLAMGGAVVVAVGLVGFLYVHAHAAVTSAQSDLAAAQQQQTTLQAERNSLQTVQNVYDEVAAKQAMLSTAMGGEVRWSTYLNDLALGMPDHVWLTNVSATEADPTAAGATTTTTTPTDPSVPAGIGTVSFSGIAFSHDDVANWLDALAKEKGYVDPYFTNSTESFIGTQKIVNFQSSVVLSDAAKSGRYAKPAGS